MELEMPRGIYPRTEKHLEILDSARKSRKEWIPWNKGKKCSQLHGRKKGSKIPSMCGENNPSKRREVKLKISSALKGKPSWNKGLHWSKETREKVRLALLGHIHLEETKEKIRQKRLFQVFPTKDTSIEIKVQNALKEKGVIFQTHHPRRGQPDIFINPNICIFLDGDYWHKLRGRKEHDREMTEKLMSEGYIVLRFSESQINNDLENVVSEIIRIMGRHLEPAEVKPLLVEILASVIVEAGSPHPSGQGSSQALVYSDGAN